jgi:hypothetical protein
VSFYCISKQGEIVRLEQNRVSYSLSMFGFIYRDWLDAESMGGRGRGRGRVRFGGSRDSALGDILDETREDLGLSHAQMEQLAVRVSPSRDMELSCG